jgi:apolipoprotein N-acyltransferase
VWPESSVAFWLDDARNLRRSLLRGLSTPVLFGGIRHGERNERGMRREHNTAFLTDRDGTVVGTYDKTYLLAFGEYLPFGETFPVLYDISEHSGRFSPGNHVHPLELPLGAHPERGERPEVVRIATLICYEDIVSSFVRRAVSEGDPHVLINMTVDTWFGDTHEPYVHLSLAAFRAIEHRRFLVRATNSGISAIVDALGRTTEQTPVFVATSFAGEVRLLSGHHTLFELLGHWPGGLAILLSAFVVLRRKRP